MKYLQLHTGVICVQDDFRPRIDFPFPIVCKVHKTTSSDEISDLMKSLPANSYAL
jgi:hypothetical protein